MSTSHSNQQTIDHLGGSSRTATTPEAGQLQSYWPWLLFKEAKQLAPIMIALVACSFILHLLGKFGYSNEQTMMHGVSLLMVPLLFAIGAGPMLVSQEKEQGSLGWLSSLPVTPRSIVMSKFIVCILGLVLSWILSIGLTGLLAPSFLTSASVKDANIGHWIASTFGLLSLGFALAWMLSTAISSLIALVFSTCGMYALGIAALSMIFKSEAYDRPLEILGLALISLVIPLLTVAYAPRWFVAGAKTESVFSLSSWGIGGSRQFSENKRPVFWTLSPSSSLIWQISRQNTLLWIGLLLIVIMLGCLFLHYTFDTPSPADFFLSALLPLGLVLSWLGASVFGSDAYRQRINFLAQRGVAPGLIWWTRMILPLGSVLLGLVAFILLQWSLTEYRLPFIGAGNLSTPVLTVGVLMVFTFTQWFSQWTRSTLIGFCVAPAAAALIIGFLIFVMVFLRAPWWMMLPSITVAMLATRVMLCPWMDGRFDWRYWTSHGGLLLVALTIPLTPFLYTWATYPDMSATMKRSLVAEVEGYQQSPRPDIVDLVSNRTSAANDDPKATPKGIAELIGARLDAMELELSSIDGPIALPGNKIAVSSVDLMSLRIDAMMDSEDSGDREQADRLRYQRTMVLLDNLCRHLRLAERLQEQDYADSIERWMVSELNRPGRREIFTEQQYARIVSRLADQDARHQARRRAVVMAWNESIIQPDHQFEKVVTKDERVLLAPRWLVSWRDAATAAESLLRHLESSTPRPLSYPGELDSIGLGSVPPPGALWYRPWESKAEELAKSLRSTPATKVNDDE